MKIYTRLFLLCFVFALGIAGCDSLNEDDSLMPTSARTALFKDELGWKELPEGEKVSLSRVQFNAQGYFIVTTGGLWRVPFLQERLDVLQFGATENNENYAMREGERLVLYLQPDFALEHTGETPVRWYPLPRSYEMERPLTIAIAPSWTSFRTMVWFQNMALYGGYVQNNKNEMEPLRGTAIRVGSQTFLSFADYRGSYMRAIAEGRGSSLGRGERKGKSIGKRGAKSGSESLSTLKQKALDALEKEGGSVAALSSRMKANSAIKKTILNALAAHNTGQVLQGVNTFAPGMLANLDLNSPEVKSGLSQVQSAIASRVQQKPPKAFSLTNNASASQKAFAPQSLAATGKGGGMGMKLTSPAARSLSEATSLGGGGNNQTRGSIYGGATFERGRWNSLPLGARPSIPSGARSGLTGSANASSRRSH